MLGCDFCSVRTPPTWLYPCEDFVMQKLGSSDQVSTGAWMACERCGELIEAGNWEGLANRAVDEYVKMKGTPVPRALRRALYHRIAELHQNFRKFRKPQPRTRVGGTQ